MRHGVPYHARDGWTRIGDPGPARRVIARESAPARRGPRPLAGPAGRAATAPGATSARPFGHILVEEGFDKVRMEHVAARAGVGKATIYRHWPSKQALAHEVLFELANPHLAVPDVGDTRTELLATVLAPMRALTETDFGPVIRALLSEIARDPELGDPFRATVVQARRDEVARVIARGIRRGDLRPDLRADMATEMLVGPVYFRLMFGGKLDATSRSGSSTRSCRAGRCAAGARSPRTGCSRLSAALSRPAGSSLQQHQEGSGGQAWAARRRAGAASRRRRRPPASGRPGAARRWRPGPRDATARPRVTPSPTRPRLRTQRSDVGQDRGQPAAALDEGGRASERPSR